MEIYTRRNYENFDLVPKLPVYLRSIGHKEFSKGKTEVAPSQRCPFFEMIWCNRGIGEITLYRQKFQMTLNDVFFYYPNEEHLLTAHSDNWELYWCTFNGPAAAAFFDGYGYGRKMRASENFPIELYQEISSVIGESSPVLFRTQLACLCRLLALIGGVDATENDLLESALELIRKHLSDPELNVNYLAECLNCHRTTLTRIFRQKLGRLPSQAIRDRRLHAAETFLSGTSLPVYEVAARCGFSSASSFCRFFQSIHRLTPQDYRGKQQGNTIVSASSLRKP